MAYEDLDSGYKDLFEDIPNTDYFEYDWERDYAQELFERGFGHSSEDYDALGLTPEEVTAAREEFFDFMGMEIDDFPWDDWREEMGYE